MKILFSRSGFCKKSILSSLFIMLATQVAFAIPISLKPHAPAAYTVQPGDTLIGIAYRYLDDPSDWGLLVENNPQIRNPYLLYPGEVLVLSTQKSNPRITIKKGGIIKLTPQIRSYPLDKPIPIIPLSTIEPFLNSALVVNKEMMKNTPYVVAHANGYVTTGAGDQIYVMGIPPSAKKGTEFAIYREGEAYKDPQNKLVLGYSAINVGFAELLKNGQPATFLVTQTTREVLTGDNLLPSYRAHLSHDFIPTLPQYPIHGQIISVLDGVTQISQYQVVVIDRGKIDGLIRGNLLDIYQLGQTISDPIKKEKVKLPNERAGQLMVFRVFDRVSYGVVLVATAPLHTMDIVQNPKEK